MKKYLFIILCCVCFSCQTKKFIATPDMTIYMSPGGGSCVMPTYLIIKKYSKTFDMYMPGITTSTFGKWEEKNDTLYLTPQYEYLSRSRGMVPISEKDSSIISIPQKYVKGKNTLTDVTDYSPLDIEGIPTYDSKEVFIKLRSAKY